MPLWYKDAIIYGLSVDTFQDSNGDGIGDFAGLTTRLDYIADLGVTCLWLLPSFPSFERDNGYDVTNYYAVDPRLGTLEDFLTFLREAGKRGIRVIMDLVMNHTSDRHPWFQAARRDRGSRFHDYYVWTAAPPPPDPGESTIFPGEETSVWAYDECAGEYYYHRFYHFEPDLNVANLEVQEEIRKVMDFWLSFGIAGFRLDAASHMVEEKGLKGTRPDDPHAVLKSFRSLVIQRNPEAILLGEADVSHQELADYFGAGDELHLLFNFFLDNYLFLAMAGEDAHALIRALSQLPPIPESGQWANFLRNLDELDLERLSEEERQRVYRAFAPREHMSIFGRGIRRRLAPMLKDRRRLELAFSLLFSMPGTPVLIYGDEIGMGEDLSLQGRWAVRTPMQWSGGRNAGFSTASSARLIRRPISKGKFNYRHINVEAEANAPASFLNWMKRLIVTRRKCPEWGWGNLRILDDGEPGILSHCSEYKGTVLVAVHNLAGKACAVRLTLNAPLQGRLVPVLGNSIAVAQAGEFRLRLEPYGYAWYRLLRDDAS